jgi:hypothetical protein
MQSGQESMISSKQVKKTAYDTLVAEAKLVTLLTIFCQAFEHMFSI